MSKGSEKKTLRVSLRLMCLVLLFTHSRSSSMAGKTARGCRDWDPSGESDICCNACHPGNRIYSRCGQDPEVLCTPCEKDTYTVKANELSCLKCNQCVGAQILVKQCTTSSDTVCGCKVGMKCGDEKCNFCVQECREGQEPTDKRSCRACPEGTFNDQIHQKCKPWSKSCLDPKATMLKGDAFNNIKCLRTPENNSTPSITTLQTHLKPTNRSEDATIPLIVVIVVLIAIILTIASAAIRKRIQKKNKCLEKVHIAQVITTPTTDEPRTLRSEPGEYSYHPPQQEHGSSSESLGTSQTSKDPLLV